MLRLEVSANAPPASASDAVLIAPVCSPGARPGVVPCKASSARCRPERASQARRNPKWVVTLMTYQIPVSLRRRGLAALAAMLISSVSCAPICAAQTGDTTPNQPLPNRPMAPPSPTANSQVGNGSVHQGVITPPPTGDAAINRGAPPVSQFPTPVIAPPGTPGGDQNVVPK